MPAFESRVVAAGPAYEENRAFMLDAIADMHGLQKRARDASAASGPRFAKRGQLLPRERLTLALDEGAPWLELCSLAGYLRDTSNPAKTVPGCSSIAGIGYVSGVRCMVVVDDAGIAAGSAQPMGGDKMLRLEAIDIKNRLPFIHLVESAGANLLGYKVEDFVIGGGLFANLARLSAAGIPVIALTHGSSTAGGAYMTGLADYVIMVRDRAKAFLAGPPLLKAATGEVATDEELGGAVMHATVSGLAEYLAEDDVDGVRILRELVGNLGWTQGNELPEGPAPALDTEELLGLFPKDHKKPVDMREVIARLVDGSEMMEYKPLYGPQTVCVQAKLFGMQIGIITNNGPLDPAGANKATQFIHACCQNGSPLIYLHNTTGYIVGTESERAGMIKIGAKMIQAVANATVPQLTVMCGASYGAGNYGMCGRGFTPDFAFSWPTARTAVMGAEQAALTMAIVMEDGARARGLPVDVEGIETMKQKIIQTFESQMSAFYTSGAVLDDGVIDPRDTRNVLGMALSVCLSGRARQVRPLTFGVGRM